MDMGQAGHDFDLWQRVSHDGAVRCVLCSGSSPGADHGWCDAAGCLVCDACCASLLEGDQQRLISIVANAGRLVTPDALFRSCAGCERGRRIFSERLLGAVLDDAPSC